MSPVDMVGCLLERYAPSMDEIEVREARCVHMAPVVDPYGVRSCRSEPPYRHRYVPRFDNSFSVV